MGFYAVSIEDSFKDALMTPKGSVIGKPEYGTNLFELKHKPFNSEWLIDFRRCLKDACKHDERLKFKGADISSLDEQNSLVSYVVYIKNNVIRGVVNV
jgi:phage baseplate assembly protein W